MRIQFQMSPEKVSFNATQNFQVINFLVAGADEKYFDLNHD